MLKTHHKIALFMEGATGQLEGKMGSGILRYSENPIVCVIDSTKAGSSIKELLNINRECPVVAGISDALKFKPDVLLLGSAPIGGEIPGTWYETIELALSAGLSIVNGFHDRLSEKYKGCYRQDQWIWDVRSPNYDFLNSPPVAALPDNKRVLLVGTDMGIGKMTTGLELNAWAQLNHINCSFLATGQIGICITGAGIPLDAVIVDHAVKMVKNEIWNHNQSDLVIVEGQGSLLNPISTATLPLMRGSSPTHLILCHKAKMETLEKFPDIKVPPLKEFIALNEDVSSACGSLQKARTVGVALNTSHLTENEAIKEICRLENELSMPVDDVVRFGSEKIGRAIVKS